MNERREQEHKQLHRGHTLVEELGAGVLVLLQQGPPAVLGPRAAEGRARAGAWRAGGRALVPQRLEEGAAASSSATTAAAAARRPAVAQAGLMVALLRGFQQHPVQRVQQLCLSHAQLVLVTCCRRGEGGRERSGG